MSEYLVVIEHEDESWGAYCPDLPGLGVAGASREEVESLIKDAVPLHVASLREHGDPVPEPRATADYVEIR
jgi:predicted RNase H-like HicB family nuclease